MNPLFLTGANMVGSMLASAFTDSETSRQSQQATTEQEAAAFESIFQEQQARRESAVDPVEKAMALLGAEVVLKGKDGESIQGRVEHVEIKGEEPRLQIDGKLYPYSDLQQVLSTP